MPNLKSLVSMLWITSLLALLASVLVAPVRTSGFATVSPRPDCLRRNFALVPGHPTTRLRASMDIDAVPGINALLSEDEEQDRADPPHQLCVSFRIPYSFSKIPDRPLIGPRSILSLYPLRC